MGNKQSVGEISEEIGTDFEKAYNVLTKLQLKVENDAKEIFKIKYNLDEFVKPDDSGIVTYSDYINITYDLIDISDIKETIKCIIGNDESITSINGLPERVLDLVLLLAKKLYNDKIGVINSGTKSLVFNLNGKKYVFVCVICQGNLSGQKFFVKEDIISTYACYFVQEIDDPKLYKPIDQEIVTEPIADNFTI